MNYITGEPSFREIWEATIDESQRNKTKTEWGLFCDWVERKSESTNSLTHHAIDERVVGLMDRLIRRHKVPQPLLVVLHLASIISPFERSETSDKVHVRIIGTHAVASLYKECMFYKTHLSEPGYNGPPRTLWEEKHRLDSARKRYRWSKQESLIRGLLKE